MVGTRQAVRAATIRSIGGLEHIVSGASETAIRRHGTTHECLPPLWELSRVLEQPMRDPVMAPPVAARPVRYSQEPMSIPGSSVEAEIIAIVKRVSRRPIEPTAHSDLVLDLGFDSLLVFELIAELEDHFDVSIPLNDIERVRTIAQVDAHLRGLIAQQAGSR